MPPGTRLALTSFVRLPHYSTQSQAPFGRAAPAPARKQGSLALAQPPHMPPSQAVGGSRLPTAPLRYAAARLAAPTMPRSAPHPRPPASCCASLHTMPLGLPLASSCMGPLRARCLAHWISPARSGRLRRRRIKNGSFDCRPLPFLTRRLTSAALSAMGFVAQTPMGTSGYFELFRAASGSHADAVG